MEASLSYAPGGAPATGGNVSFPVWLIFLAVVIIGAVIILRRWRKKSR